jgi:MFS family permease
LNGDTVRKNFILNISEGGLYMASGAFISAQTVMPALITRLGGSNVAVGAIGVTVYVGVFLPQIFAARYVETLPWKKPWAITFGLLQRLVILLIGLSVLIFGSSRPSIALALFFGLFAVNQVLGGVATPGWFDLIAKLTPANRRGRLLGIRTSVGGATALLGGVVLTWFLATFEFPLSYSLACFCAFLLQISSILIQSRLVEEEPSRTVTMRPMFAFLRELPMVFRENREFREFLTASAFLVLAAMPVGFFTVYALKHFQADESVVGRFTMSIMGIQVVSALVMGFVGDRYGNKSALTSAAVALLCACVTALIAPTPGWFTIVYVFLGINIGTEVMTRYNMSIEYGPVEKRSTFVGLMNTVLAPFYLSGVLGGYISDWFGYKAVFGCGALFSLIGILLLTYRVTEPRGPAHYARRSQR